MPGDKAFKSKINLLGILDTRVYRKKWLKGMSLTLEVIDRSVQGINHRMALHLSLIGKQQMQFSIKWKKDCELVDP